MEEFRHCKVCGIIFEPKDKLQHICSEECRRIENIRIIKELYHQRRAIMEERECVVCGTKFQVPMTSKRDTCNKICKQIKYSGLKVTVAKNEQVEPKKKFCLNDKLKQYAEVGLTYAEVQKANTLSNIPKINVNIFKEEKENE